MDYLSVTTTIDDAEAAGALARGAVSARLAACAQVEGPLESVYRWRGAIETAREWRVTLKTSAARYAALETFIKERHPYETPEILAHAVAAGSEGYIAWLQSEVEDRPPQ